MEAVVEVGVEEMVGVMEDAKRTIMVRVEDVQVLHKIVVHQRRLQKLQRLQRLPGLKMVDLARTKDSQGKNLHQTMTY